MRLGFVSTRLAGTDGVSLESAKWAQVLWDLGHESFWFSGRSDRAPEISMCVPEAFFGHPENEWINRRIWGNTRRSPLVTERIHEMSAYLEGMLRRFVKRFDIEVLIIENALTIPVHVPLGVALTEFLAESAMPAVAHHHDFYWERVRFSVNSVHDYLDMSFPPRLPNVLHTVINQEAQHQLAFRKGLSSVLVPNVFEFERDPPGIDDYTKDFRQEIGLSEEDLLILQPTRMVPRKGIEHAIKLVSMLKDSRCKLVISHEAGDEGYEYEQMLVRMAEDEGVDLRLIGNRVGERRQLDSDGRKMFTLWDIYPHADLVTYPSLYEGFGNALLEAFYFKVPVVLNRYSIYVQDIEPKGFQTVTFDGYVTRETVREVQTLLHDPHLREVIGEENYHLAQRYYGYEALKALLQGIFTGELGA